MKKKAEESSYWISRSDLRNRKNVRHIPDPRGAQKQRRETHPHKNQRKADHGKEASQSVPSIPKV
jgi:hypothetical protein